MLESRAATALHVPADQAWRGGSWMLCVEAVCGLSFVAQDKDLHCTSGVTELMTWPQRVACARHDPRAHVAQHVADLTCIMSASVLPVVVLHS